MKYHVRFLNSANEAGVRAKYTDYLSDALTFAQTYSKRRTRNRFNRFLVFQNAEPVPVATHLVEMGEIRALS